MLRGAPQNQPCVFTKIKLITLKQKIMSNPDYLPKKDAYFLTWVINFLQNLFPRLAKLGITQTVYDGLKALSDDFEAAMAKANNPEARTSAAIDEKDEARKALEKQLRADIKEHLTYNSALTDADRIIMGLPVHKTTKTPIPVPTSLVKAEVNLPSPGVVEIHFQNADSEHKAKPFGVSGAEIVHAILDAPTTDWRLLVHSDFDTNSPFKLVFEGPDRGKTVYFALRWENTKGEKGPWNAIQSAIIP
jgi:hypothetical protein